MSRLTPCTVLGLDRRCRGRPNFPVISIERTCGPAKPLDAQDMSPVETCLRGARAARNPVEQVRGEQPQCLRPADTYVGGYPSYDDVLTCLHMYGPSSAGASTGTRRRFGHYPGSIQRREVRISRSK
jgi:hypothetical protein